MANKKIKLTRTELKAQRDALARFERYLPTLKLKQQQIQSSIVQMRQTHTRVKNEMDGAQRHMVAYQGLFNDMSGISIQQLATPDKVDTVTHSIAGIRVPQFKHAHFPRGNYSLFATAPWTDRALEDLRNVNRLKAELEVVADCLNVLQNELKKVMQRVNLFEKIMIPQTQDIIRRIRIAVGDQMTAGVARAKIAKAKLEQKQHQNAKEVVAV